MQRVQTSLWKKHLPALLGAVLCLLITAALAVCIRAQTHGMFVYPLDDSYIHLTVARNVAEHHVWGVNPTTFASASSSPGWTVMLALIDAISGTHVVTPIVLNLLLAACLLFVADAVIRREAPSASLKFRILASAALVIATPLPNLVIIGMEHVAQTLFLLLVIWYGARTAALGKSHEVPNRDVCILCFSAMAAGALRYESVFAVIVVSALLLFRRRFRVTALFAASSAFGPVVFGIYSHRISGFWLPFSVVAKAGLAHHPFKDGLRYLLGELGFLPLIPALLLIWLVRKRSRRVSDTAQLMLLLTAAVGTLHVLFAPVGWLMRYESYFVCIGLICLLVAFAQDDIRLPEWRSFSRLSTYQQALGVAIVLVFVPFSLKLLHRAELGIVNPVRAGVDRYNEHIQMARMVGSLYSHDVVVVNDIGALAFYTPARLLDVVGLGSQEPLRDIREKKAFSPEDMSRWAEREHASIAIIQIDWKTNRTAIPANWPLVQVWHIPRNVVFFDHSIAFFAVHPYDVRRLCDALKQYPLTPEDKVSYDACPELTKDPSAFQAGIVDRVAQPPS